MFIFVVLSAGLVMTGLFVVVKSASVVVPAVAAVANSVSVLSEVMSLGKVVWKRGTLVAVGG